MFVISTEGRNLLWTAAGKKIKGWRRRKQISPFGRNDKHYEEEECKRCSYRALMISPSMFGLESSRTRVWILLSALVVELINLVIVSVLD